MYPVGFNKYFKEKLRIKKNKPIIYSAKIGKKNFEKIENIDREDE